jgi:hypothetical protein
MGLKEFFTIKMVYFFPYPQYSSIPLFHSDGINRFPLKNLYYQKVVEFPRRLIPHCGAAANHRANRFFDRHISGVNRLAL